MGGWWERRKDMTLRELQLEAARWALATERERRDDDEKWKARNLAGLERLVRRLETSDKPILVDRGGQFLTDRELKRNP
jgi:hypothetical protein